MAVLVFLAAVAAHRFGALATPWLLALALVSTALALLAMLLALVGFWQLWHVGARGGKASTMALFLVLIPLAPAALALPDAVTKPPIRDITTDVTDPPAWIKEPSQDQGWLPKQAAVTSNDREAQVIAYPDITGRRYEGALDRVLAAVRKVSGEQGVSILMEKGAGSLPGRPEAKVKSGGGGAMAETPDFIPIPLPRPDSGPGLLGGPSGDVILQGATRSLVFGLYSDVVVRLREETETTLVDVRVASRYGTHDLGAGNRFIQRYLKALDAELLGIAGD